MKTELKELPSADWLLWQLVDSAFPTGGFAHSGGLEAAWQHGEVRGRVDLSSFLDASLLQAGHAMLPFVTAAIDEPETPRPRPALRCVHGNHVNSQSRQPRPGKGVVAASHADFCVPANTALPCGHFAPVVFV
jgi:hypothetical protein